MDVRLDRPYRLAERVGNLGVRKLLHMPQHHRLAIAHRKAGDANRQVVHLGAPHHLSWPELKGFNFEGGTVIQPEFTALLAGLVLYTSAFIAEIVRSGILALHKGQSEAAMALGLSRGQVMRLVLLPQALRVIVPPMTSQYLNIVKNSSLAIAIGYPDLVASINVTINQTGQAIENVLIIMAAYLSVSLSISAFMNWYNKRIALRER